MKKKDQELIAEAYQKVLSINEGEYEREAALDKKEAYKQSLMRDEEPEAEVDPLEDPRFQDVLDTLEDLRVSYPDDFEKFVIRLNDIVDYKKGVSL